VRVDVLYRHFSEKRKAWVDILTALMITLMAVPMVWFGGYLTWEAFESGQTSVSAAEIVLWPSMATVPLGATLIILQAWASASLAMRFLATGRKGGE
jgi:TRAP-type mannitol/chloroaromatic compound transport system permease small subunit